jgi:16S rRNA processing protein RimM
MLKFLQVGKIVNTHGVKGEVKVIPLTDDPQRFEKLKWVYSGEDQSKQVFDIESVKYFKNTVIVKFKGISDRDSAEKLKNTYIYVDRENAVKLPENSYFICDLIDMEVQDENGGVLGTIKDVIKTGSNDVYIVKSENNKEILVPALRSVVKSVSLEDRRMVVSLPEGLIEDEV